VANDPFRQNADNIGCAGVRLLGPLGIGPQQQCRIMSAARGDDMHRYPLVEQQRFMTAAEVVEAQLWKAETANSHLECLRNRSRIAQRGELGPVAAGEHQGTIGKPYKGQVDGCTIRNPGYKATMLLTFRHEQINQAVVDRNGPKAARLGVFGDAAGLGLFDRSLNRQRLVLRGSRSSGAPKFHCGVPP
jgi:hypothetical protein